MQENKTVTIKLNAPKLTLKQAEHRSKIHSLPVSSQVDQETNHDDLESNHRDAPDLADHHPSITSLQDITTSSSITNPELAIQSTTIPVVCLRSVKLHDLSNTVQNLTPNSPGTAPPNDEQDEARDREN